MRIPQVEIADLWPLDADDPEDMPGRNAERAGLARRHDYFGDLGQVAARAFIEGAVIRGQLVDGVDNDRSCRAAFVRIDGSVGFSGRLHSRRLFLSALPLAGEGA